MSLLSTLNLAKAAEVRAILCATVLSSQLVASGQVARVGPSRGTLVLDGGLTSY